MKEKSDVVRGSRLVARGSRLVAREGGCNGQDARCPSESACNGQDARCPSEDEFDLTPPEVPVPDRLDFLAAELPEEYEGPWIVKLVRSFGGARDAGMDVLEDLFQTACAAAAKAVDDAKAEGGDVTAFVKTAVRIALAKANRSFDMFTKHIGYAEDGERKPDADPRERLVENLADVKYLPSRQRKVDAVRLAALLVSPPLPCGSAGRLAPPREGRAAARPPPRWRLSMREARRGRLAPPCGSAGRLAPPNEAVAWAQG